MFSLPHKKVIIIVSMEEHFAQNHAEYVYTLLTGKSEVLSFLKSLIFHD